MKCPSCGATVPAAPAGAVARCLDCGTPVRGESGADSPADSGGYRTPFGRLVTQVQASGVLAAGWDFPDLGDAAPKLATLAKNLSGALKKASGGGVAEYKSFDAVRGRCVWAVPGDRRSTPAPLADARLPLSGATVRGVVLAVGAALRRLHKVGLSAGDFDPHMVFADGRDVTIVPTPWLASLARWGVGSTAEMPYVAPELSSPDPADGPADPARADLHALGTLTVRLLTGADPAVSAGRLPGEAKSSLRVWDAFVDGCRRTHPERRFASVGEALKNVPAERAGKLRRPPGAAKAKVSRPNPVAAAEQVPAPTPTVTPSRGRWTRRGVLAAGAAGLVGAGYYYRDRIAEYVPAASGCSAPTPAGSATASCGTRTAATTGRRGGC